MKIAAYETRADERQYFAVAATQLNVEIIYIEETLNEQTIGQATGCAGVSILGHSNVGPVILDRLKAMDIVYLSTRTVGYNHIDTDYAARIGVKVSNVHYGPDGVADFTIMLMLMSIRHYKQSMFRGNVNDYSLFGLIGREMKDLTIGVIGCGRIGAAVINHLQGFGCKILAYDTFENPGLQGKATFVSLDTLYRESDMITLHTALVKDTYHMINQETIALMKDGVVLINCARGELIDIEAMIEGIENEKIGALGLDVIETEEGIYHQDRRSDILSNRQMAYIRQFPNVTMTHHMAFYTEAAVQCMVNDSVTNLVACIQNGTCEYDIKTY
jgi:lactate dehydrogenase-like 2-hydroxyacid dehydrogenase